MAFDPSNSAIRVDASLEEKLKGATHEQIKELLKEAAVEQRLAVREWDQSILTATELASTAPKKVGKVVVLNGVKHSLIGNDEADLLAQENAMYRAAMEQPAATTQQATEQPHDISTGRFVSAEDAAATAELELQFKRGDISAADYLQKSGAVADYLAKQGVPLEDLKAQVAEKQGQRLEQSWADATEEFKARHPEWAGGEFNKNAIGQILVENNLIGAEDKVAALELAYNHARENNLLGENPDTTYARELSEARSPEEINSVNHKYFGSGIFNR